MLFAMWTSTYRYVVCHVRENEILTNSLGYLICEGEKRNFLLCFCSMKVGTLTFRLFFVIWRWESQHFAVKNRVAVLFATRDILRCTTFRHVVCNVKWKSQLFPMWFGNPRWEFQHFAMLFAMCINMNSAMPVLHSAIEILTFRLCYFQCDSSKSILFLCYA